MLTRRPLRSRHTESKIQAAPAVKFKAWLQIRALPWDKNQFEILHLLSNHRVNKHPLTRSQAEKLLEALANCGIPWGRIRGPKSAARYKKMLPKEYHTS